MHPVTRAVRDLYAQYPYPAGGYSLRLGFDVRRALSYVDAQRPAGKPLHVLDAGCSKGSGLLGAAQAQPGIRFTGIDMNVVALEQAVEVGNRMGLQNVDLAVVDLETLDGVEVPEGGYDLIICSGVVHHLVDPTAGLGRLARLLAPHGVLDLMVYARAGRIGLERVARAIAAEVPAELPVPERLVAAKAMAAARAPVDPDWAEAAQQPDIEFVDRYLHPSFVSYTLDGFRSLVHGAGLELLRWTDPQAWRPAEGSTGSAWIDAATVEPTLKPRMYDALLTHQGVGARRPCARHQVDATGWAVNPEGVMMAGSRTLWAGTRPGGWAWHPAVGEARPLSVGPAAVAAPFLGTIGRPFRGVELLGHLAEHGVPADVGRQLLLALEDLDVVWRPHEVELQDRQDVPQLEVAA